MKHPQIEFQEHWNLIKSKILEESLHKISKDREQIVHQMSVRGLLASGIVCSSLVDSYFTHLSERKDALIKAFKNLVIQKNIRLNDEVKENISGDLQQVFDSELIIKNLETIHIIKDQVAQHISQINSRIKLHNNSLDSDLKLLWLDIKDHSPNIIEQSKSNPKAFISYSTLDKKAGHAVKSALEKIGINSFLAHDDLEVSEEWKKRIIHELEECSIFIPILSQAFKQSLWCSQEVGFVSRNKDILTIPLSLDDTIPFGFISHVQSKKIHSERLSPTDFKPIVNRYPKTAIPRVIKLLKTSSTFRGSEALFELLQPHFSLLTKFDVDALVEISIDNGQIWDAKRCREEYLPQFIEINKHLIDASQLTALLHQIETHE